MSDPEVAGSRSRRQAAGDSIASRRVQILREDVSNRIAAGEVIDRPLSIVRELLDNALDSGARNVSVWVERGGLDSIRVPDDGSGLTREDLDLCWRAHATSKIATVEDLETARTLGFRGEALSSIAVSATMEIISRPQDQRTAWRLRVRDGVRTSLEAAAGNPGTDVRVSALFEHQPARRAFLRSASAESALCAAVFLDKALAHPSVTFRMYANGELRHHLPAAGVVDRVLGAYPDLHATGLESVETSAAGVRVAVVLGRPEAARKDRRMLQVFVNGRRITEYSLVQAVEYGYTGTVPGGLHPVAFVFVRMEPALVDFNVHPAKREARFRDPGALHRLVVDAVRRRVSAATPSPAVHSPGVAEAQLPWMIGPAPQPAPVGVPEALTARTHAAPAAPAGPAPEARAGVVCYGQVFGVFLIAERGGVLYLIDQHAAHERLIFDRLNGENPTVQELLLPISFEAGPEEAAHIERARGELAASGVVVERGPGRSWEVTGLDERLGRIPEEKLLETIRGRVGEPHSIRRRLCTLAACATAVREGEPLDAATAADLAGRALALPDPRCPHGRPVWHALSRDELYRLVKREI